MKKQLLLSILIIGCVAGLFADPFQEALVLELEGKVDAAQEAYYNNWIDTEDAEQLYHSGRLLFEAGDFALAEIQLRDFLSSTDDVGLKKDGLILMAFIYGNTGRAHEGITIARQLAKLNDPTPKVLYLYYILSADNDQSSDAAEAAKLIAEKYPESPENKLLRGTNPDIALFPSLLFSIPTVPIEAENAELADRKVNTEVLLAEDKDTGQDIRQDENLTVAAIQVGSFQYQENAERMIEKLNSFSLKAEIRNVTQNYRTVYRVVIPLAPASMEDVREQANKTLILLKDYGIEGFLLF